MRVECPNCEAGIHVAEPPADDAPLKCPKCKARFTLDDEDDDRPAPKKGKGAAKKKPRKDEAEKKFPVAAAVGGGVALVAVIGIVVGVLATRKGDPKPDTKPAETASNTASDDRPAAVKPDTPLPAEGAVTDGEAGTTPRAARPLPGQKAPPKKVTPPVARVDPSAGGEPGTAAGNGPPGAGEDPGVAKGSPAKAPTTPTVRPPAGVPAGLAELFTRAVDSKPPTLRAAALQPAGDDHVLDVPTFYSLRVAREATAKKGPVVGKAGVAPKVAKMTVAELEKACAYIKVDAGEQSSTGSGFLIAHVADVGLVATNHHVISAAIRPRFGAGPGKVTAVFNSGTAGERAYKADVIAFDPVADLAILKVERPAGSTDPWPRPINPYGTPAKLERGMACEFWGFPLGAALVGGGNKNPQISLGKASVSSFQESKDGRTERVIISGTMNPGNSGGPLVDGDGRLIGIAVAIVNPRRGTGIGYAVPVDDLIALMEGKLWSKMIMFIPTGIEGGNAKFLALVPVMDPMNNIATVFVRRWAGDGEPPAAEKDKYTGYAPIGLVKKKGAAARNLPGVEESKPLDKFRIADGSSLAFLAGEITVPADAKQVMIQVASQTKPNPQTGQVLTAASRPVGFTLKVGDVDVATDAKPLADLATNAAGMAGQVVVVKGRIASPPNTRDAVQPFAVVGPDGKRPERVRFLVSRDLAAEFDEVELEHQPLQVRMVCVVGKAEGDGEVPVRVARLDFVGRGGDQIVRTIPSAGGAKDPLFALNRNPRAFAGKAVEFKSAAALLSAPGAGGAPNVQLAVICPGLRSPRNLSFVLSNRMKQLLLEKGIPPNAPLDVKVTGRVEDSPGPAGTVARVTVRKVEFIDPTGGGDNLVVEE